MRPETFERACRISRTHREALQWLYDIVSDMPAPVIVCEIGSWAGGSAIVLAEAVLDAGGGMVFCVENFSKTDGKEGPHTVPDDVREQFNTNTRDYPQIMLLDEGSPAAAESIPDGCLALLFVDGAHDAASVETDLGAFVPKVGADGIICGHDYIGEPDGVAATVNRFLGFAPQQLEGDLWIVHKTALDHGKS